MARLVTITFRGLCARASHGATESSNVYCHPEGGAHIPTLAIPVKSIQTGSTSWTPDAITLDAGGGQLAIWDISGQRLSFGRRGEAQTYTASLLEDIAFGEVQPTARVKSAAAIERVIYPSLKRQGATVTIRGGEVFFVRPPSFRGALATAATAAADLVPFDVSGSLVWEAHLPAYDSADFEFTNQSNEIIRLKNLVSTKPMHVDIRVTNVSTTMFPNGLTHFAHYYDLLDGVAVADQLVLSELRQERDEYDCVPPVVLD